MTFSQNDFSNLDRIVRGLSEPPYYDTIPEILDGYNRFPVSMSAEEHIYKLYEDFLIEKKYCTIKDGWTANSVINGYKSLQLDSKGRELVYLNKSFSEIQFEI